MSEDKQKFKIDDNFYIACKYGHETTILSANPFGEILSLNPVYLGVGEGTIDKTINKFKENYNNERK